MPYKSRTTILSQQPTTLKFQQSQMDNNTRKLKHSSTNTSTGQIVSSKFGNPSPQPIHTDFSKIELHETCCDTKPGHATPPTASHCSDTNRVHLYTDPINAEPLSYWTHT
ncbi:hypothetical protein XENORESO_015886 [Xenotaenia resolanae]|uniref:Uncharacterized protein n=1 Tax=Xenotaenia resolanae TaxID=208358 RepID=A0ABV0WT13_9TELE